MSSSTIAVIHLLKWDSSLHSSQLAHLLFFVYPKRVASALFTSFQEISNWAFIYSALFFKIIYNVKNCNQQLYYIPESSGFMRPVKFRMHKNFQEIPPAEYLLFCWIKACAIPDWLQHIFGFEFRLLFFWQIEEFIAHIQHRPHQWFWYSMIYHLHQKRIAP